VFLFFQEEQERKKQELLQRKAESKASLEEEISKIKIGGKQTLAKVTRAEIEVNAQYLCPRESLEIYAPTCLG
jgi:hypothetical protein